MNIKTAKSDLGNWNSLTAYNQGLVLERLDDKLGKTSIVINMEGKILFSYMNSMVENNIKLNESFIINKIITKSSRHIPFVSFHNYSGEEVYTGTSIDMLKMHEDCEPILIINSSSDKDTTNIADNSISYKKFIEEKDGQSKFQVYNYNGLFNNGALYFGKDGK